MSVKQKIIALICSGCLIASAVLSQSNITRAEYFFNTDPGFGLAKPISISANPDIQNRQVSLPVSSLPYGLNTLFIRSRDANNVWSITNNFLFFKASSLNTVNIVAAEYFIDTDPGFGKANPIPIAGSSNITDKPFTINIAIASIGLHTLFIRSKDADGIWSITNSFLFLKAPALQATNIIAAEYFVDTDPGFGKANPVSITSTPNVTDKPLAVDVSSTSIGLHTLFIRSKDANGKWSITNSFLFLKAPSASFPDVAGAEYFIDKDPGFGKAIAIAIGGTTDVGNSALSIDISSLLQGLHTLFLRSKDANGKWSITNTFLFYKASNTLYNITEAEYFFDTDPGFGNGNKIPGIMQAVTDSNVNYSIDISALDSGYHDLFIRSKNTNGQWSITNYLRFYKSNGIVPVTWLSFEAIPSQNKVMLQWKTALEENSSYFEVQHSLDGTNFNGIAKVTAIGNSNSVTTYNFTHLSPATDKTNYYRLKQFDKDGKFTYSPIRTARFESTPAFVVMPNPVIDNLTIHTTEGGLLIHIFESDGKEVIAQKMNNYTTSINCQPLAKGVYYMVAEKNGKVLYTREILKQ